NTAKDALRFLESHEVAAVVANERLGQTVATDLLNQIADRFPHLHAPVIIVSDGAAGVQSEDLISFGRVFHYLRKPFSPDAFGEVVHRAVERYALAVENER